MKINVNVWQGRSNGIANLQVKKSQIKVTGCEKSSEDVAY